MNTSENSSIMNAMMQYDDTALRLAHIRHKMKNSIVKHFAEIQKIELANLKKLKFVDVDKTVPKMTLTSDAQVGKQSEKECRDYLKLEPAIFEQTENAVNELDSVCEIMKKLIKEKESTCK